MLHGIEHFVNEPRTRALPVDNNWIENQICPWAPGLQLAVYRVAA